MEIKAEKIDDNSYWPGDSEKAKKTAYTRSQKFDLGEVPSTKCKQRRHSSCVGFKRTWYGPLVSKFWPHDCYYDVTCTCTCHDNLYYKPRLKTLIGPRLRDQAYKPEDFEAR